MAENIRKSVFAIVEEVTEGTPVAPSAGTDFVAAQDGAFDMVPAVNQLENAEIKASIGKAKGISGLEAPTASFSAYLRASGVEGQAPNYGLFLKSIFGTESILGSEKTTAAASTVSVVKLAAGGSSYSRGMSVLVKDGTNGYSLRPVLSIATNDLTLGFHLDAAPASGINTGLPVTYSPANDSHPSLTMWGYIANGGALEVISGLKVTGMTVDVAAGELINASFEMEGVKFYYDPIQIDANDTKLDFFDGTLTMVATVEAKLWRDPHELAAAIQTSMNAQGSADTFTVIYNDTGASKGKFTISTDGATLTLKWSTGANTANTIGDAIGFSVGADDTGATTYTSDNAQSWAATLTPSYDDADPYVAKSNEIFIGDAEDIATMCASSVSISMTNTRAVVPCIAGETGINGSVINSREVTVDVVATMERHNVDAFNRYMNNTQTAFFFAFGQKTGGNWVPGKCGTLYIPTGTVSGFVTGEADGHVTVEMTVTAYVDSDGNGEVYLNFL